jgi:hypothetical protein
MKRLFLRHYLTASAFLLGVSLSALILAMGYPKNAWNYFTQSGIALGSSIGISVVGNRAKKNGY